MNSEYTRRVDPKAARKLLSGSLKKLARTEIKNEGWLNFGRSIVGTMRARDLRLYPNRTMGQEFEIRARRHGAKIFLDYGEERWSWRELDDRAARVANALQQLGMAHGDALGIMLPNLPAFLEIFFASQRVGACAVPVNTSLHGNSLQYILENAEVKYLFVTPEFRPACAAVMERMDTPPRLILVPDAQGSAANSLLAHTDDLLFADFLETAPQVSADADIDPQTSSILMYTSGTTGNPKGVVYRYGHSQANMTRVGAHVLLDADDVYYTCLPLFHANALMVTTLDAMFAGARVVLSRRFSARNFWHEVRASRATVFNTIGTMIGIMMKTPPSRLDRVHNVRKVISAACPPELWEAFEQRFGVPIWEAFAAVDGGGFSTFNVGNAPAGSVGKPLTKTKYRLINDDGNDVPTGSPGQLIHYVGKKAGAQVAYHNNSEASRDKLRDGWVYSGDLLRQDADGNLYFVGRATDSMRCGGENISALQVETEADAYPDVLESAAFGVPAELGEEDVMIVVQPREGKTIDPSQLYEWLTEKLPRFALPRYIRVMQQLPKTATHRVIKGSLKEAGITDDTWTRPEVRRASA